jgi:hypothetical protein
MVFQPGNNANPGGRPSDKELRKMIRSHSSDLIKEAIRIAFYSKSEAIRLSAITMLLDRGFGKVSASVEMEETDATVKETMPPQEALAAVARIIIETERKMGLEPLLTATTQERVQRIMEAPGPVPPAFYSAIVASKTLQ